MGGKIQITYKSQRGFSNTRWDRANPGVTITVDRGTKPKHSNAAMSYSGDLCKIRKLNPDWPKLWAARVDEMKKTNALPGSPAFFKNKRLDATGEEKGWDIEYNRFWSNFWRSGAKLPAACARARFEALNTGITQMLEAGTLFVQKKFISPPRDKCGRVRGGWRYKRHCYSKLRWARLKYRTERISPKLSLGLCFDVVGMRRPTKTQAEEEDEKRQAVKAESREKLDAHKEIYDKKRTKLDEEQKERNEKIQGFELMRQKEEDRLRTARQERDWTNQDRHYKNIIFSHEQRIAYLSQPMYATNKHKQRELKRQKSSLAKAKLRLQKKQARRLQYAARNEKRSKNYEKRAKDRVNRRQQWMEKRQKQWDKRRAIRAKKQEDRRKQREQSRQMRKQSMMSMVVYHNKQKAEAKALMDTMRKHYSVMQTNDPEWQMIAQKKARNTLATSEWQNQYLEINLCTNDACPPGLITAIVMQPDPEHLCWVSKYKVSYSEGTCDSKLQNGRCLGRKWKPSKWFFYSRTPAAQDAKQTFLNSGDVLDGSQPHIMPEWKHHEWNNWKDPGWTTSLTANLVKKTMIDRPFRARFVRIHPVCWHGP